MSIEFPVATRHRLDMTKKNVESDVKAEYMFTHMHVNVFVKNIGVGRMMERMGESGETLLLCFNRNS